MRVGGYVGMTMRDCGRRVNIGKGLGTNRLYVKGDDGAARKLEYGKRNREIKQADSY